MPTLIHQRVRAAKNGENPTVICRMPSGWAVIGDRQFIPGSCLLLADPVVPDLNALTGAQRTQFLNDMAIIGDALLEVTTSFRINYEILGNTEPFLHAHISPRYLNEPDEPRAVPVWVGYSRDELISQPFDLERDQPLMRQLAAAIKNKVTQIKNNDLHKPSYTPKQGQYLAFIYYYTKLNHRPPAQADIQRYFRVSPPTVHQMILKLEEKGFLKRVPGHARSIAVSLPLEQLPPLE